MASGKSGPGAEPEELYPGGKPAKSLSAQQMATLKTLCEATLTLLPLGNTKASSRAAFLQSGMGRIRTQKE
jgi:hypothetical protein